jgi:hypothetical protein
VSGFNPDEYLEEPAAHVDPDDVRSVSPEAQRRAIEALLAPQVGAGETFLNNAVDAIPLGGRLRDILQAIVDRDVGVRARLTPQAREELLRMGEEVPPTAEEPRGLLDTYRTVRDERRARTAAGSEQNPWSARAGAATGIGLSIAAPLPAVSIAGKGVAVGKKATGAARLLQLARSPTAARIGSAAATGAGYGALGGATEGEADLTQGDIRGVLADTVRGGASGAAWGAGGGAVAEGARAGIPLLRRYALQKARENIQGSSDIAAATRKPMRDESVAQVLDDGHIRPLATTRDTYGRISEAAETEGEELGRLVSELEKRGVKGPDAQALAEDLMARYRREWKTNLNDAEAEVFSEAADRLVKRAGPAPGEAGPAARNLGFGQTERIKSNAQKQARFDRLRLSGTDEARQEVASVIRQANEDQVAAWMAEKGRGRGDKIMGGKFKTQKKVVGNYLDAQAAAERGASKQMQKPSVGLTDTIMGAAAGGGNLLTSAFLANMNAGVRSRFPSTAAVGAEALRKSLATGRAGERLGVGASAFGPVAADEARRWANEQNPEDPNLSPQMRALLELLRTRKEQ